MMFEDHEVKHNMVRQASHPLAADGVDLLEASAPAGLGGPRPGWPVFKMHGCLSPWKTWKSLQQIDIISYPKR